MSQIKVLFDYRNAPNKGVYGFSEYDYRQAENGKVTQTMDGNGHHKILFFLICYGKCNSAHELGKRQISANGVGENENQGTESNGNNCSPMSKKAVNYTPKEDFFSDWPNHTSHQEKDNEIMMEYRPGAVHQFQRIDSK